MCIFTSDKDIPGHVRLSTRTLQYLVIPLLSFALLIVGQSPKEFCSLFVTHQSYHIHKTTIVSQL